MTEQDFNRIYKEYTKPLIYFAEKILHEKYMAEDIVAEIMAKLYYKICDLKDEKVVRSWLYTSVKNACINCNKHTRIKNQVGFEKYGIWPSEQFQSGEWHTIEHDPFQDSADLESTYIKADLFRLVLKDIRNLPEKRRQIFMLWLDDWSLVEIGKMLNISPATCGVQLFRVKTFCKKIREKLNKDFAIAD